MRDPLWMQGDDPDECEECGYEHDVDSECLDGEDTDAMWYAMHE